MTREMMRGQNLCYKCHEKYFPGRVCKNRTLYALEAEEFVDVIEKIEEPNTE